MTAIKIFRIPFACLGAVGGFIVGYAIWLFCLGIGPVMLLKMIFINPFYYFKIFDGDIDWESECQLQLLGFHMAIIVFESIMEGKIDL